jgi:hypothetical protein
MSVMVRLLSDPPDTPPPEVEHELAKEFQHSSRWIARSGAWIYAAMLLFLPALYALGVRDGAVVAGVFGCFGLTVVLSIYFASHQHHTAVALAAMVVSTLGLALTSRFFSPLILTPAAIAINSTAYALFVEPRHRILVAIVGLLGLLTPLALEVAGLTASTFSFEDGILHVLPDAVELHPGWSVFIMTAAGAMAVALGCFGVGHIRDRLVEAERRVFIYAWHLREFVPHAARRATDPTR